MTLAAISDQTYSTRRPLPYDTNGVGGTAVYLQDVNFVAIMPLVAQGLSSVGIPMPKNKQLANLNTKQWVTSAEYQTHIEDSVEVTKIPDIVDNDTLVVNGTKYKVFRADHWPATSLLKGFVYLTIEESN